MEHQGNCKPILTQYLEGLGFREQTKSIILFMVTTSSVMTYNTTATKPTTVCDLWHCNVVCDV
jgi:hypothetical protein